MNKENKNKQVENQKSETTHYSKCGCKKCIGYGGSYYKNKQQSLESIARAGKSTKQKLEVMEEILKGEKYILIKGYKKEIHILPNDKLKHRLEQAKKEEREGIVNLLKTVVNQIEKPDEFWKINDFYRYPKNVEPDGDIKINKNND